MSDDLRAQIYSNLISRETEDLLDIWQNGDTTEWDEQAFEIVREILTERLGYVPPASINRQVSQILAAVERHLERSELDQALTECNLAIQMKPNLAVAYNYRGDIYDEMGQSEDAITNYQKAIQLEPEFKEAWDNLLSLEAELETEFQGSPARQHLDQALEYSSDDEPEKALAECETAQTMLPGIAAAYNYFGMVLQSLDRLEPAIEAYLKAVELNPRFYAARENLANARVHWEEEQYLPFTGEPSAETQPAGEEQADTGLDDESLISENHEPVPQWLYMDRNAFLLTGWPGHRTRAGRTGYDPLEIEFELAHVEGTIIHSLLLGRFRTHNMFYLLLMTYLGLIFSLPLLGVAALAQESSFLIIFLTVYSPYLIVGIMLLINVFLSLVSEEPDGLDERGQTFF